MKVVGQKAAGKNIAAGDIGLKLGEIAETPDIVVIGVDGKGSVDEIVVLAVEGVIEPCLSFHDWAGEGKARQELVKAPSVFILDGGKKIGGGEAEMIVADSGVEAEHAAGAFAVFGGLARGLDLDAAKGVGAHADDQLSVGGLGHVEAVEQGHRLVSLGSGYVRLAILILHDPGDEVENVAIVVGAGIDDVDDVEAADSFLRGNLACIDGRRRFVNVDDLANFLLMREDDLDERTGRDLHDGLDHLIKAFFCDAQLVGSGGQGRKAAAAGEVGQAAECGERRRL